MWLNRASQPVVTLPRRKAHLDFSVVFPYLPEQTCFEQAGSSAVEGTSQPASISKSEKNPSSALCRKRTFHEFRRVPSAYRPPAQISNNERACTQALLLYRQTWGY
jgi:hypothetical protein